MCFGTKGLIPVVKLFVVKGKIIEVWLRPKPTLWLPNDKNNLP